MTDQEQQEVLAEVDRLRVTIVSGFDAALRELALVRDDLREIRRALEKMVEQKP